jgi:hypothetical protein
VIPAIIGFVALVQLQIMFFGNWATPNEKKLGVIRGVGVIPGASIPRHQTSASVTRNRMKNSQKPDPDGMLAVGAYAERR